MRRFHLYYVLPTLALLAAAMLPLVSGRATLYTRDVLTSHYPLKAAQAQLLRQGEWPLIDPFRAGGQPLVGNPNALPLYPDNLLYLAASPLWALNAHFWLHLLLAPVGVFWLGRAWGLGRPAAWTAGACYATGGFFLSLFNLYNLVAGAALAPALVAACLDATRRRPPRWAAPAAGVLWCLLLLAGDPFFAALALALAGAAVVARGGASLPRGGRVAAGLGLGTLVASPMLVEMARILPLSFRGYWRFSAEAALSQSWDPRTAVEWLLPFFFGEPDFAFWGLGYHGGNPPLLYSLYPGALALALLALAGRPRDRAGWWAWSALGGGVFLALGAWNPLVRLLFYLPGASVLRYPVKFYLAAAIGAALLCGLGCERLLAGGERRLRRILVLLAALYAVVATVLLFLPGSTAALLRGLDSERLSDAVFAAQRLRWLWGAVASLAVVTLLALASGLVRRRPYAAAAFLVGIHVAAQCALLQPLYDSDDVEPYAEPPAALAAVPADARLAHGGSGDLFGAAVGSPLELLGDLRFATLARAHFAQLYPFAGIPWGRRYELNHSPEGLDTFFVISLARAFQRLDDLERVRVLEASGVDVLLLDRELAPAARGRTRLRAHFPDERAPGGPLDLWVYELPNAVPRNRLATTVLRAPQMNAALEELTSERFDSRTTTVLPGDGPPAVRPPGRLEVVSDAIEQLEATVASSAGGVLVTQRAFLGIYRASIDGRPAVPVVADFHRLGLEVPAGEHQVRLWIDRRPFRAALATAAAALAGLALLAWPRRRETE